MTASIGAFKELNPSPFVAAFKVAQNPIGKPTQAIKEFGDYVAAKVLRSLDPI